MMRKRQTRRSLSMNGGLYHRLDLYCIDHERSVSGLVGELVAEWLDDNEMEPTLCGQAPTTCSGLDGERDHG